MNILSVYACRLTGKYMAEKNVINNCTNLETFLWFLFISMMLDLVIHV